MRVDHLSCIGNALRDNIVMDPEALGNVTGCPPPPFLTKIWHDIK
jgi:hypothetical protein